ncbi:preprotein translocase subunit SecY [Fontisphaera persica]|jgi:preprotein translocase subunit SecY|uniref:preprotein translocase subunit SecY n=1 Tax=Fontisphaera persica TaxID=2974023 RepID=UPI0024BFE601|nr:preprotein translocase subunit SecY [Fontisphaera persica]WCJ59581.1 preprotein translocase subunit SecY [Fontisphaera persica]
MLAKIANTFTNAFRIPELKSRILFTLFILAVCRLVAVIPIPGLDGSVLFEYFRDLEKQQGQGGGLMGMYSLFTGGALERCAIGSLGIMPYISATIIIQLLTAVIPRLSKLAREEGGRTKIIQYGRYLTVLLCLGWGMIMAHVWENPREMFPGLTEDLVRNPGWFYRIQTTVILTTGTLLLMWLGEQITDRGIGNGVSLIITIGIVARVPQAGHALVDMFSAGGAIAEKFTIFHGVFLILMLAAVVAGTIAITQAQRKVAVQYAQRAVGRKVYQGGTSFMPLRVNYAGVMPIIFAQAILMFPQKILESLGNLPGVGAGLKGIFRAIGASLNHGEPAYFLIYGLMIMFFSYFWVATQFNEIQIADDLKKYGGYIPGVRPGQATSDFLHHAMSRITLAGAVFLTIIAVIPDLLYKVMNVPYQVGQFFGGTSLLITVGVMLDTMRQMETHLLMRHYDGFLKKGRLRGRI